MTALTSVDLSSMRLELGAWELDAAAEAHDERLGSSFEDWGKCGPYISKLRVERGGAACVVVITPRRDPGIGCRSVASVFSRLIAEFGADGLPQSVLWVADSRPAQDGRRPRFQARGLLTLETIRNPRVRQRVLADTEFAVQERMAGEDADDYAARALGIRQHLSPQAQVLPRNALTLTGDRGKPDGLLWNSSTRELLIVEAKMREATFEEGLSQVFQYAAQARWHERFKDARVLSALIAEAHADRRIDRECMQFLKSGIEPKFLIDGASVDL